ncbi:hypothetical protein GGR56DRAFT_225069 [Xylariaceae sp. FL0804]|nr:hypothetical protein GGR56DRAFT_225069 [Xylariaceae sp. FL0804]
MPWLKSLDGTLLRLYSGIIVVVRVCVAHPIRPLMRLSSSGPSSPQETPLSVTACINMACPEEGEPRPVDAYLLRFLGGRGRACRRQPGQPMGRETTDAVRRPTVDSARDRRESIITAPSIIIVRVVGTMGRSSAPGETLGLSRSLPSFAQRARSPQTLFKPSWPIMGLGRAHECAASPFFAFFFYGVLLRSQSSGRGMCQI